MNVKIKIKHRRKIFATSELEIECERPEDLATIGKYVNFSADINRKVK